MTASTEVEQTPSIDWKHFDVENPGFNPKDAVGELPHPWRRAARNLGISVLLCAGLAIGVGEVADGTDAGTLNRYRENVVEDESNVLEADLAFDRLTQELGEACVTKVELYFPEGSLADTPEDSIVSDLLLASNQPCGDDPSEVRADARAYINAHLERESLEARYEETKEALPGVQEDAEDRLWPNLLPIGMLVGAFVGLLPAQDGYARKRNKRFELIPTRISNYLHQHMKSSPKHLAAVQERSRLRAADRTDMRIRDLDYSIEDFEDDQRRARKDITKQIVQRYFPNDTKRRQVW